MKHNKDTFIAALKQAVKDTQQPPTSGLPCAIASLRVVRDGLIKNAVIAKDPKMVDAIKAEFSELIKSLCAPDAKLAGFASNASAAAKAAELETKQTSTVLAGIVD